MLKSAEKVLTTSSAANPEDDDQELQRKLAVYRELILEETQSEVRWRLEI